jgi:hypothetical protein
MQSRRLLFTAFMATAMCLSPTQARENENAAEDLKPPPPKVEPKVPPILPVETTLDGCCCEPTCCSTSCHHGFFARLFSHRTHCFSCRTHHHFVWHCHVRTVHLWHPHSGCSSCGYAWTSPSGNTYVWAETGYQQYPQYPQYQVTSDNRLVTIAYPATVSLVSRRSYRFSEGDVKKLAETKSPELLVGSGFSDFFEGNHGSALAHFDGSLLNDDKNPLAWYGKALAERALGDTDAALTALRHADKMLREQHLPEAKLNNLFERLASADRQWLRESRNL